MPFGVNPLVFIAGIVALACMSIVVAAAIKKPKRTTRVRQDEYPKTQDVKTGLAVPVRYTQQKKQPDGTIKRITVSRTGFLQPKVRPGVRFLLVKTGLQVLPYRMHYVDLRNLDANGELCFDEDYSEAINPATGKPDYSPELEDILLQGIHQQMVEVATQFWRFIFQRQHLVFMGLGVIAFSLSALGIASVFHLGGGIAVSWVQHPIGGTYTP